MKFFIRMLVTHKVLVKCLNLPKDTSMNWMARERFEKIFAFFKSVAIKNIKKWCNSNTHSSSQNNLVHCKYNEYYQKL